jgi:uncharacterized protein YegL
MKKGLTELVFILDKSGSMAGLEDDTIGGFNSMLQKQKLVDSECLITTVLFDTCYNLLHDRIDIKAVGPITQKEYSVGGMTALLDAIGKTIHKIGNAQRHTADDFRAENVMFVIITDGLENSSREYSPEKVKSQIERQKSKYNWEFIFLGANIDAALTAEQYGICADRAVDYIADSKGTKLNFSVMNRVVTGFRECIGIPDEGFEEIRNDHKSRRRSK